MTISERKASSFHHLYTCLNTHTHTAGCATVYQLRSASTTSVMAESSENHLQQEIMTDDSSSLNVNSTSNLHQMEDDKQQPELVKLSATTEDPMLGFLTLLAKVERPACANCESKDLSPMFFCNTCSKSIRLFSIYI